MTAQPVVLGRRYRLVERIGSGGMAVVWRAHDQVLHRPVAVKMLSPQLAAEPDNLPLLRAEALAVAGLAHPRITSVYDYGQQRLDGHEQPYLVMELVDGVTLREALQDSASGLGWQAAVSITAQVAAALAAAHERGIVHRDVTPANIMLTAAGVKVLDFGICVLSGFDDGQDDELLGTVDYIAPERVTGGTVVPASDVYSLGMVMYRCLSGRLPWERTTPTQRLRQHVFSPPDVLPPVPGMPAAVMELCLSCLAKNPADRPTAAEIAAELDRWSVPEPGAARPAAADERTRLLAMPTRLTRRERHPITAAAGRLAAAVRSLPPRRRAGLSAGAVAVVALAGALALNAGRADVAGASAGSTPPDACHVGLRINATGTGYTAALAVSSVRDRPQPWRLTFTVDDDWRVSGGRAETVRQDGRQAVVTGRVDLTAGSPVAIGLAGTGSASAAAPANFMLDGTACRSDVNVFSSVPSPVTKVGTAPGTPHPAGAPEPRGPRTKPKKPKP